ncbi:hypothetical protein Psta_3484 [Pirellula staleyi DSM 6068]|uniref:Uncharacterized protein n=1 Tax=Pirellula staleyi (strain ATCC 27377 / DSM 6068 / ICPB 4128) TaxID=530564 RepID=D2QYI7_PIRSD|nr:hypothetical protein [Pirellula staleyi]ADB18146.1 hypothetical protein Psta_3484 [Pirellula staleyi DSM 6068]
MNRICIVTFSVSLLVLVMPGLLVAQQAEGQRFDLTKRASEIDPAAKEYPKIGFVFADPKGKVLDLQHAVVDTRVKSEGKLVIWLMDHNQGLFERVSSYGLHGIQVHYANRWFSQLTKAQHDDGHSIGEIRLEAATGEDHSPHVSIEKPDSIAGRSIRFVQWLSKHHPEGKWEQFLTKDGSDLLWDRVILAGISHGSTTAARFAKHQKVERVVMFSGPRDNTENWQELPSATPAHRYFGFTHVLDGGWTSDHYCRSWKMLGLPAYGEITNVEMIAAPYNNSRQLISMSDVMNNPGRAHTMVVPGGSAGKDGSGKFIHEEVWRYLFTHPVEKTGTPAPKDFSCEMRPQP